MILHNEKIIFDIMGSNASCDKFLPDGGIVQPLQ
jgi:hypothetical protein